MRICATTVRDRRHNEEQSEAEGGYESGLSDRIVFMFIPGAMRLLCVHGGLVKVSEIWKVVLRNVYGLLIDL